MMIVVAIGDGYDFSKGLTQITTKNSLSNSTSEPLKVYDAKCSICQSMIGSVKRIHNFSGAHSFLLHSFPYGIICVIVNGNVLRGLLTLNSWYWCDSFDR